MKNEIINALKQDRLLRNQEEICIFENALERLATFEQIIPGSLNRSLMKHIRSEMDMHMYG